MCPPREVAKGGQHLHKSAFAPAEEKDICVRCAQELDWLVENTF